MIIENANLDYWLLVQQVDKLTGEVQIIKEHNVEQPYHTASTVKTVFCGLFLENCSNLLHNIVPIQSQNKLAGGFLNEISEQNQVSYEVLLYLMIIISDNTATMTIYNTLLERLWDLTKFLQQHFSTSKTQIFDARNNYDYALSTTQEFGMLLNYFLVHSPYKDTIKNILSHQYVKGRGLRYIDDKKFILTGNKTGQLDDQINDCWFLETENEIYLYTIFMKTPTAIPFQYGVENEYYKIIGKLIKECIS